MTRRGQVLWARIQRMLAQAYFGQFDCVFVAALHRLVDEARPRETRRVDSSIDPRFRSVNGEQRRRGLPCVPELLSSDRRSDTEASGAMTPAPLSNGRKRSWKICQRRWPDIPARMPPSDPK